MIKKFHGAAAFTLIEVIIAISLSCVVIFGMMQAYHNLNEYLSKVRDILGANRKVCLLFNQMERDFSTAFIPLINKEEANKEEINKKEESDKDKEKLKIYFMATVDDQEVKRIDERSVHLFKNVALINTNPLQVFGQRRGRLVRVSYDLRRDKEKTKHGVFSCYQLWRKETTDIDNVKMKKNELSGPTEKEKANPIHEFLVADNIKALYIEYVLKKKEEKFFDVWGNTKETMGVVPMRVHVRIEFLTATLTKGHEYSTYFTVFSYPTIQEEKKEKKDVSGKATPEEKAAAEKSGGDLPTGTPEVVKQ